MRTKLPTAAWIVTAALTVGAARAQDCPEDLPVIEPGKLTMSINATIPPTQYIDESGEIVGLNRELGDMLAERLCLEPVYQNVSFEVQIPGLGSDRWDMINTGLYYTPERAQIMQLVPYRVNALALIAQADNPLGVEGPEDLAGHVVGVEIAGFEEERLRELDAAQVAEGLEPMDIRVFNTYGDTFLALGAGQLDAVFAGDSIGTYYQEQGRFTKPVTGLLPGTPSAFATDQMALAEAIRDALAAMAEDGSYQETMEKYGATTIDAWSEYPGGFEVFYTPEG